MLNLIFIIAVVLLALVFIVLTSRSKIFRVYEKYSTVRNTCGMDGEELSNYYMNKYKLYDMEFARTSRSIADCYVPSQKMLVLSDETVDHDSIATLAIVSHEFGHALQHNERYPLFIVTNALQRITRLTNALILPLFIAGIIMYWCNFHTYSIDMTCLIMSAVLLGFNILLKIMTIPLEVNASNRARHMLVDGELVTKKEMRAIRSLLSAAAMTYLAGLLDGIIITPNKIRGWFQKFKEM